MTNNWRPNIADGETPLYLAIARAVGTDVANGRLKPGDRLPTQRCLADELGVALGTVTRAYAEAERRGLVSGRGRRGTVVATGRRDRASRLGALMASGDVIDLSANHPSSFLDPGLSSALRAIARRSDNGALLLYAPAEGLRMHRESMADWLVRQGVPTDADSVVMTSGAQHAICLALDVLTKPGDAIACEALTYPGFTAAAASRGVKLRPIPLDKNGLIPEALDEICRETSIHVLYTVPTLHNPTTVSLTLDRKEAIARIAERHSITIIEDEIHRPFATFPAKPFVALIPEHSVLVTSVSKSVAGGLRVGCVVAPGHLANSFAQAAQTSLVATSSLNAEVLKTWADNGELERTIARRRKEVTARQRLARRILGESAPLQPESPYMWFELPDHSPVHGFTHEARNRGIAVAAGELFSVDSTYSPNAIRIALCAPPSRTLLQQGIERLRDLLDGAPPRATVTL